MAAVAVVFVVLSSGSASAASGAAVCNGGSVAPGAYSSLVIAGVCTVDSGSVSVHGNLTIAGNAALFAAFGGSNVTVGGNLSVGTNGVLVLGCEPEAFICFNDPDQENGTMTTSDSVGGNLTANGALAVLAHHDAVGGNATVTGGGGGVNCDPQDILEGSPAYATFEDITIGGDLTINDWHSCWLGAFRNTIHGNLNFHDNVTADPDGNEVATNTVGHNLNCSADNPTPQFGDSGGSPNIVGGRATGQCKGLV